MEIMPFTTSQLRFSRNIAWASLTLMGAVPAVHADTNEPGVPLPAVFPWSGIPASENHPSPPAAENLAVPDHHQKPAGTFRCADVNKAPENARFVTALKRTTGPEREWSAAPEPVLALAGFSMAWLTTAGLLMSVVFLLRYASMRYSSRLYLYDCGRKGGYLLYGNSSGRRRVRRRTSPFFRAFRWLPRFLKKEIPRVENRYQGTVDRSVSGL